VAPDGASLRPAVAAALGCEVDWLEDVRSEALDYDAFLAHRAVRRVRGHARVDGERRPWSLIEKTTEGPGRADPYLLDNGAREFAAYSSGLLDDLAPRVRPPRLYGCRADEDGRLVLWLEEVVHDGARPLDAASLLAAARDLGAMAGSWHRQVPAEPWLFTGWIDRHSQPEAVPAGLAALNTDSREAVALLGSRLAAGRDLIAAQPRVRDILESLPQTLCHHDAVGANVFVSSGTTVLIDWESVGPGPVGADLASLLFSSVRRGDAMASVVASVLELAVSSYTESVREQDPSISRSDIRRGFDAAVALRWKLIADLADAVGRDSPIRRGSRPNEPARESLGELVALADLLLDAAHRALDH
jgi:hypothetical protein